MATKKLVLHLSDKARDFLINKGFNPQYGARPLRRCIERHIEDPLAEELLRGNLPENSLVEMDIDKDGEGLSFHAIPSKPAEEKPEPATDSSEK